MRSVTPRQSIDSAKRGSRRAIKIGRGDEGGDRAPLNDPVQGNLDGQYRACRATAGRRDAVGDAEAERMHPLSSVRAESKRGIGEGGRG